MVKNGTPWKSLTSPRPARFLVIHAHSLDPHPCELPIPTKERKQPWGPVDLLVRESVEVMCHSVQGKKDINTVS